MTRKTEVKYILIYLILTLIAVLIATNFWWTDGLNLSFLKIETFFILFSVGISWIGIIYLTIYLIRKFIVNIDFENILGPIDLISNEMFHKEIGMKNAMKFKNSMTFITFPILILTILCFVLVIKTYEINQLKTYGKIENVIVNEIKYDIKKNAYIHFIYNQEKNATNLSNYENLKVRDSVKIIYSINNPKIVEYQSH